MTRYQVELPSGSHVMGFVLADAWSWLRTPGEPPFDVIPLQTFANLRNAVNDGSADFFLWEHFTSKRYYDNGSIKRIGEIYTPWSSWQIVARYDAGDLRLDDLFKKLDHGIKYFEQHPDEAVHYISTNLDYSTEDARAWLATVKFAENTKGVEMETVEKTIGVLKKAGVLERELNIELLVSSVQKM
ncbi:MAG: hypothetical protein HETSPECPRED_001827 [Heterodermia speciosa]|uniref:Ca3427-like PBP 2 domain-containing protein n=1 Tax=Heterodermia speciosa TaxID=116794 RepID=A0A8H3PEN1_9LECA|nr:MAG: hypothetical protein HETSPECPRED_001827 [Heterodermia speciosa]